MKNNKYMDIYNFLKELIVNKKIKPGEKIPSESQLTKKFNVSRNTVRRAITMLINEGLVNSIHGKGVFILENSSPSFSIGGLQSFEEASKKNNLKYKTIIHSFEIIKTDKNLAKKTTFPLNTKLYKIKRIRNIDNENIILDVNYFNYEIIKGLNKIIAKKSIYDYVENNLKLNIAGAKKVLSVEKIEACEKNLLDLDNNELVAIIKNFVYLDNGVLFEYTESKHRYDKFSFTSYVRRI